MPGKFADQVDKIAALYTWGSRYSSHLTGGQNDQGKYWKARKDERGKKLGTC